METSSTISIGSCLKEHQKIYKEWFNIADSDGDGRVSGNDATKFFAMSKLSRQELKQVWAVADSKRQGFLGLSEFITAMKLVSLAQEGHEITSDLLKGSIDMKSVELPVLEGLENVVSKQKVSKTNVDVEDNG
jgi:EH domain-containing protein 1